MNKINGYLSHNFQGEFSWCLKNALVYNVYNIAFQSVMYQYAGMECIGFSYKIIVQYRQAKF